ncbi:MAG: flavodoxin domain-containing protein [Candidatus Izemoplasmatales bacterium]
MNKTLILYKTNKGMTEKLSNILKQRVETCDLYELNQFNGHLDDYTNILLGTPIYIGKIHKKVKMFIDENISTLLKKNVFCFFSGMNFKEEANVINLNFNSELKNHFTFSYLGGSYQFDKMNFLQKMIIRKVSGENKSKEIILEDKLQAFIEKIK